MSEFNQRARARVKPHIIQVGLVTPTISMANTQTPAAHTVAVTPVTPGVALTTPAQTPHTVAVTEIAAGIVLEAAMTPKTVAVTLVTPTVVLV